jgi:hypothetical protein
MHQMLLVPGVFLHPFVILNTLEHNLTETVIVGYVCHLRVVNLCRKRASIGCVVYLLFVT